MIYQRECYACKKTLGYESYGLTLEARSSGKCVAVEATGKVKKTLCFPCSVVFCDFLSGTAMMRDLRPQGEFKVKR